MVAQKTAQPIRGWAVLIGINDYTDRFTHPPLRCCIRDAIGLYVLLTRPEYGNFMPTRVLLLLDGSDSEVRFAAQSVVQRLEAEYRFAARPGIVNEIVSKRLLPEREDILAAIHRAAHNTNPEDLLLIHFAGHGYVFDGEIYLIPPRARHPLYFWTAIPIVQIKAWLSESQARAKVLLLDACYSGPPAATSVFPNNGQLVGTLFSDTDEVAVFASCLPWEQCFELDDDRRNPFHGIFTYYLLEGLSGEADQTSKGYVTLRDLYHYVNDQVKTWVVAEISGGPSQTPGMNRFGEQHAHRIVVSGDHTTAQTDKVQEEIPALKMETAPLLQVRVWAQPHFAPLSAVERIGVEPTKLPDAVFKVGEYVRIGCHVNRDAHIYVLNVDSSGRVIQIFPTENNVNAQQNYFIPGESDDFALPVEGPSGVETLIAIATVNPAPFLDDSQQANQLLLGRNMLERSEQDLARATEALNRLPREHWVVAQYQFLVRE